MLIRVFFLLFIVTSAGTYCAAERYGDNAASAQALQQVLPLIKQYQSELEAFEEAFALLKKELAQSKHAQQELMMDKAQLQELLVVADTTKRNLADAEQHQREDFQEIQQLKASLAQAEQAQQKVEKEKYDLLDEIKKIDSQLAYARSLEGLLVHKQGAGVWLGLGLCYIVYKKELFNWISRYEQKLVKVIQAKNNRMRHLLRESLFFKKVSRLRFTK